MKAAICLLFISLLGLRTCFAIGTPPVILVQPSSQTVLLSGSVTFSVTAFSGTTLSYQWMKNGVNISGATSSSYTISPVTTNDATGYSVLVVNGGGSVTSSTATLTVLVLPTISTQPQSQAAFMGQSATFSVSAGGTSPLRYRWKLNGTNISNATNAVLTLTNIQASSAGNYSVVVTNTVGSVTSTVAALTLYLPPAFTNQPQSQALILGQTATFAVAASGTAPFSYQWIVNSTNIPSTTNVSLTLTNVQTTDAASYKVVITNIAGSATSTVATLTVYVPPTITTQPQSVGTVGGPGVSTTFFVVAGGTAPLSYQWYFNNAKMGPGSTSSNLTVNVGGPPNAGNYSVVVTNAGGSVTSAVATLTVYVLPGIQTQPANQTALLGQNASFSVVANGTSPYAYQWYFNSTNTISGATNSTLNLTNVQTTTGGSYLVVVTNIAGSITSQVATLTVYVPPTITTQPQSVGTVGAPGVSTTFFVVAGGTAPLSYQWYFNNAKMGPGSTSSNLTVNVGGPPNAGNYSVVVTNAGGSVTSAVATLTVYVLPGIQSQPANQTALLGQNASFSVVANGTSPYAYQWYFNSTNTISGATNSTLNLTNVQTTTGGS